jgi:hypothetical protein
MFIRFFTAASLFCLFLTGNLLAQSSQSDIIANAGFTYPTNIPYASHQEASDIASDANSILVASFTLRDGGAANDADALATELTDITLDLGPNWQMIRLIELRTAADGPITVASILVTGQTVTWSGMTSPNSITAADNGSTNFGVRVSFMNTPATVIDNTRVTITISAVTANPATSTFAAGNGGGATTSTSGVNNQIEVTATKLLFVQGPSNVALNGTMAPAVTIESTDANNVRDLDNTSQVSVTSTGTLTGTPVQVNAVNGLATFAGLVHTAIGTGRSLSATAATPSLTGIGPSSTFNVGGSDILLTPTFTFLQNIPYNNFQEAANIQNTGTSVVVASFRIRDDGGNNAFDGSSTVMTGLTLDLGPNFAMIRRIALYNAAGTTELSGTNEQAVSSQTVVFSGLSGANVTAADNGTQDILVRVSFQDPMTDNLQFSFTVTNATSTGTPFAPSNAGGVSTSTAGDDNRIEVTATKLLFVQGPSNVVANTSMAPSVTIESVDPLDNRDLDNTSNVVVTSTGTLAGTPVTVAAVNGLATFSSLSHTVAPVAGRTLSATANTPALTASGASATFSVTGTSDIIATAGFDPPDNIAYETFQETDITVASPVIGKFDVRDGAGSSDADALPTVLTNITFTITGGFANLRRMAIYDAAGTTELAEVAVSSGTVAFSGLNISAADNGTTAFTVLASFNDPVTDNAQIQLTVNAATAQTANSQFVAANAGGAATPTTGNDNRIEVTATKTLFVVGPATAFINANMTPAVTIEAVDALDNRDLDNTSQISLTSTGTLTGTPVQVNAVAGLATFSTLQHSVVGTGLTLSATAATPALTGVGPSSTFAIVGGSDIIVNAGFTIPSNIPYNTFQEPADIVNSATSVIVAKFDIRDGSGLADPDATSTSLTSLTVDLGPNFALIRRVALFNAAGTTQVTGAGAEQAPVGLSQTVVFTGLSGANITAGDGLTTTFSIRASFMNTVTDNTQFSITITNTVTAAGSSMAAANAGGAVTPTTADLNRIEVLATKLLFVQAPSNVDVNVAMTPSVTIQAADPLNNRDLDNGSSIAVTSTGTLSGTPVTVVATSGLSTFPTLTHTVVQGGRTLSATATAPALTAVGPSATFNVTGTSDIIPFGGFVYPSNIAYETFQETNITVASPVVAKFNIRDGAGAADGDALPTVLTDITFSLSNFTNIRRMAIYDAAGTTELAEVAVSSGTVTFNGLTISAADGGSTAFTVLASFNDPVTDNQQFQLTVTSATAQAGNSGFIAANAGGAVTSVATDDNRIEVTATKRLHRWLLR